MGTDHRPYVEEGGETNHEVQMTNGLPVNKPSILILFHYNTDTQFPPSTQTFEIVFKGHTTLPKLTLKGSCLQRKPPK